MIPVKRPILLNGFVVELSSPALTLYTQQLPKNTALQPLRDRYGADWESLSRGRSPSTPFWARDLSTSTDVPATLPRRPTVTARRPACSSASP